MKAGIFCCLVLLSVNAFAQVDSSYRVAYLEQRGTEQRKMLARVEGKQVWIDQEVGDFDRPWFLQGLPPLETTTVIQLEGLPPLPIHRTFAAPEKISRQEKNYLLYSVTYEMAAKQELIPLNKTENQLNQQLKPFGIESIQLQGKGRVMMLEGQNKVIIEEFVLRGELIDQEGPKPWQIEFARVGIW